MVELDNEKIRELYLATNLSQRLIIERNKKIFQEDKWQNYVEFLLTHMVAQIMKIVTFA